MSDEATMSVIAEIAAERCRQINVEGWTPEHDDQWRQGQMAGAAACYAMHGLEIGDRIPEDNDDYLPERVAALTRDLWPWDRKWWKPANRRRDLVKAAALIVAEIERMDRQDQRAVAGDGPAVSARSYPTTQPDNRRSLSMNDGAHGRKAWNGGSVEAAMGNARRYVDEAIAQGATLCGECGGEGGSVASGVCIECHGAGTVPPFGGLRHPSEIGALNRVAHAARAVVEMLPQGPDRSELEFALRDVNV